MLSVFVSIKRFEIHNKVALLTDNIFRILHKQNRNIGKLRSLLARIY